MACSPASAPVTAPVAVVAPPSVALQLAAQLPVGGERCSIAQPALLANTLRPLAALLSQHEQAWSLPLRAHARSERALSVSRAVVELLQFESMPAAAIRAALHDRPIRWAADRVDPCAGELTCKVWSGRFLDGETVMLSQGVWGASAAGEDACVAALRAHPDALEVSARSAFLGGTELRDSRTRIERRADGLVRVGERCYGEEAAAERALREARRGHDELPAIAGMVAGTLERQGAVLTQTISASLLELQLAHEDQQRGRRALSQERSSPVLTSVDAKDAEAVRTAVDAQLAQLSQAAPDAALLARLSALLESARALTPDDDGLVTRQYELALRWQHDPAAALTIAMQVLGARGSVRAAWQLRRRAALAELDEARLSRQLQADHALPREVALRMAHELALRVRSGGAYERAEWAFLRARELQRKSRAPALASHLSVPVLELLRMLAYLAQSAAPEDALTVQLLVLGEGRGDESPELAQDTAGAGRAGLLLTSTTEDAALRALGAALSRVLEDGPFELLLGLDGARHTSLSMVGRRVGHTLQLQQASAPLARVWSTGVERLLAAPLRGVVGATFPPDELVVQALDAAEVSLVTRAAERARAITCASDQLTVRCRGVLADTGAAQRALLAVAHERLAREARLLWSGTD
jgi:hypothetical protein